MEINIPNLVNKGANQFSLKNITKGYPVQKTKKGLYRRNKERRIKHT